MKSWGWPWGRLPGWEGWEEEGETFRAPCLRRRKLHSDLRSLHSRNEELTLVSPVSTRGCPTSCARCSWPAPPPESKRNKVLWGPHGSPTARPFSFKRLLEKNPHKPA